MGKGGRITGSSARQRPPFHAVPAPHEGISGAGSKLFSRRLRELAAYDGASITLEGESGTGKTFIAREVHRVSPRSRAPFVELDLGAIEDSLASAELFGHVPGAFTGAIRNRTGLVASAQGGTLFLDEIGKATLAVQGRLLTLLERRAVRPVGADREVLVDVRFIVATNVPLEMLEAQGRMLTDLVPRLSAFRVKVPPLRERQDDIAALAAACLEKRYQAFGCAAVPTLSHELLASMKKAPWPYNIRELDNVIQRLLVAGRGATMLGLEHCHGEDLIFLRRLALAQTQKRVLTPERAVEAVRLSGSISQAARDQDVARSTMQRHLRRAP